MRITWPLKFIASNFLVYSILIIDPKESFYYYNILLLQNLFQLSVLVVYAAKILKYSLNFMSPKQEQFSVNIIQNY